MSSKEKESRKKEAIHLHPCGGFNTLMRRLGPTGERLYLEVTWAPIVKLSPWRPSVTRPLKWSLLTRKKRKKEDINERKYVFCTTHHSYYIFYYINRIAVNAFYKRVGLLCLTARRKRIWEQEKERKKIKREYRLSRLMFVYLLRVIKENSDWRSYACFIWHYICLMGNYT